jgi:hypothetical protein
MRPYSNRFQWNLKSRPHHLIDGLDGFADRLNDEANAMFDERVSMLRKTMGASLVSMVGLYLGAAVTAIAWLVQTIPSLEEAVEFMQTIASALSGISAILLVIFILIRRRIGQLEADLVAICITRGYRPPIQGVKAYKP